MYKILSQIAGNRLFGFLHENSKHPWKLLHLWGNSIHFMGSLRDLEHINWNLKHLRKNSNPFVSNFDACQESSPHFFLKPESWAMVIRKLMGCKFQHTSRHDSTVLMSGFDECKHQLQIYTESSIFIQVA